MWNEVPHFSYEYNTWPHSTSVYNHVSKQALKIALINTLRSRRKRGHFADNIFKCIFLNENALTSIQISQKFIPMGPVNNMPALV